ncbi:MAG: hypothetical protein Q8L88_15210 [Bacteroidota bacterium]|nr:hypothetical protein [Bacteroidota bacterium]
MKKKNLMLTAIALFTTLAFSQDLATTAVDTFEDTVPNYKFSVSTTWLTFANFGPEKTNTHHYEFHFGYKLSPKDKIGIKVATWKLFAPMGIQLWDPLFLKESEFFPGRLRESGIGFTYQRLLWKGLFTTVEILPLMKTYLDENNKKIGSGFKLYTTYHFGYHITVFKDRMFIEPQVHCNYWPIDTNVPQRFKEKESKWNNYFLFEPNLYIGVNL